MTQIVARVVMDWWMDRFEEKTAANNIQLFLNKKYVDDQDLALVTLRKGTRWNGLTMEWRQEWEDEDDCLQEDDDRRCMREVRKLSNSILP